MKNMHSVRNTRASSVCGKAPEIESRAELVPEAAVLDGLERGRILEKEKRRYADEDGDSAGDGEENDVACLRICLGCKPRYEHAADEGADEGADNGQRCRDGADLAGVRVVNHVGIPGVVACVVCHRAEKAHYGVGCNDGDADEHHVVINAVAQIVRKPKRDGENSPEYRAPGYELFARADAVGQRSEKQCGKRRRGCRAYGHCRNDAELRAEVGIQKVCKPVVFDDPCYLRGKADHQQQSPVERADAFFLGAFCVPH